MLLLQGCVWSRDPPASQSVQQERLLSLLQLAAAADTAVAQPEANSHRVFNQIATALKGLEGLGRLSLHAPPYTDDE